MFVSAENDFGCLQHIFQETGFLLSPLPVFVLRIKGDVDLPGQGFLRLSQRCRKLAERGLTDYKDVDITARLLTSGSKRAVDKGDLDSCDALKRLPQTPFDADGLGYDPSYFPIEGITHVEGIIEEVPLFPGLEKAVLFQLEELSSQAPGRAWLFS